MDQMVIAAHHEAGHVVIRNFRGLVTPSFVIYEHGTGFTAPSGGIVTDLDVQLDVSLAGTVAEDLLLGRAVPPSARDVEDSIAWLAEGDFDEDWYGDLEQAIEQFQARHPQSQDEEVVSAISKSYERCRATLEQRWATVERLAAEALQAPNGVVDQDDIERICSSEDTP